MVFSNVVFLVYFLLAVLILYYTVGRIHIWVRNFILLIASLFFYAWGEPDNVVLLGMSCMMNYIFGLMLAVWDDKKRIRRFVLMTAVAFNISILFIFKYLNFTIGNINYMLDSDIPTFAELALPIGISFYTFQALSYVIDVYRKKVEVQTNLLILALYISLFPQLVAGPIVRYQSVQKQMLMRRETLDKFSVGVCRFITGLGKKLILANAFAVIADNVYGVTQLWHTQYLVPASLAWLGAFAYTLQIFFDFSAYSDMAIGLGKMFGFEFEENFNYPYVAVSLNDFWKRWHISLTSWFREYVYFPLGGSRTKNWDGLLRNLTIVWLLTGIWHGASWTFILWGLWNLVFILSERLLRFAKLKINRVMRHVYTLFVVNIGWILFRAENIDKAIEYIKNMFCLNHNGFFSETAFMFLKENSLFFVIGIAACIPPVYYREKLEQWTARKNLYLNEKVLNIFYPIAMTCLFIICGIYMAKSGYNPFIYFNF